jgi:hypothetical protein
VSTDWNVHCVECDSTHKFNDANHMVDEMKLLVKHAAAIAGLAPLLTESRDISFRLGQYGGYGDIEADRFALHLGHKLWPINEYGELLAEEL